MVIIYVGWPSLDWEEVFLGLGQACSNAGASVVEVWGVQVHNLGGGPIDLDVVIRDRMLVLTGWMQ